MIKVISFIDKWMAGGIESYLVSNYENMDTEDLDITIVTTKKYSELYDKRLEELGIKLIELIPNKRLNELNRTVKSLNSFKKLLSQDQYDVVHLNIYNGVSLVYARIAKRANVKRVIAHSHNSAIGKVRLKKLKTYAHIFSKNFYQNDIDDYWACSDFAAKWLFTGNRRQPAIIMNNGIDTNKFKYNEVKGQLFKSQLGIPADHLVLGSMGRLSSEKNQEFLIDLAERLKYRGIKFTLVIAGEGNLKNFLTKKIIEKDLKNHVFLLGAIQDTVSFYSGINYFLLPSLHEGNPLTAIEAQAAGVNCILSNTITRHAQISQHTTFLPIQNVEDWIEFILKNEKALESVRATAYEEVKSAGFDIIETADTLNNFYKM